MEVRFSPRPIPDAFDLVSTAMEIQRTILELRAENKQIAVFNIAGGTTDNERLSAVGMHLGRTERGVRP